MLVFFIFCCVYVCVGFCECEYSVWFSAYVCVIYTCVFVADYEKVGVLSWPDTQGKGRIIMTSLSVLWFSALHWHSSLVNFLQTHNVY